MTPERRLEIKNLIAECRENRGIATMSTRWSSLLDALDELLRELETAKAQEWVSVEERLPDNASDVFVCSSGGSRRVAWYNDSVKDWRPEHALKVTHWQPLPAPPERTEKQP